jgi:glycosyltransferase involved in cell wall biosynthesis
MSAPRVSAVVPVYNGAATIERALASILAQDFHDAEVIVVDDGSTDRTPEILRSYGDRIRVLRQEDRSSPAARNTGVAASRAEYIAFLDADDVWLPGRLAKTVAALDREPDAVFAYSDAVPVDDRDQPVSSRYVPPEKAHAPSQEELLADAWWPILMTTTLVRRDAYLTAGGFREEFKGSRGFADTWFFLVLRERGPFVYVPEPLVHYRRLPFVGRMEKYAPGFATFSRLMGERYGEAGSKASRQRAELYSRMLSDEGVRAMVAGDMRQARRALLCALQYKRPDRRTILRLLRAYMPLRLALALTSRRRRAAGDDVATTS